MPNQRDRNKVSVGLWIDREIRDKVRIELKKRGLTFTDFLCSKLLELLDESNQKSKKK